MKKIIAAVAVAGMTAVFAAASFAADSIDPAGVARVDISAPSCVAVNTAEAGNSYLDSNGYMAVAEVGDTLVAAGAGRTETLTSCLDSVCRVRL